MILPFCCYYYLYLPKSIAFGFISLTVADVNMYSSALYHGELARSGAVEPDKRSANSKANAVRSAHRYGTALM